MFVEDAPVDAVELEQRRASLWDGARTITEWPATRLAIDDASARGLCEVAHSLVSLPALADAPAAGELSLDQTAACRFATPDTDAELTHLARGLTPAQIDALGCDWYPPTRLDAETAHDKRSPHRPTHPGRPARSANGRRIMPVVTRPGTHRDPTASYIASFGVLGLATTLIGPALSLLRDQVGVSVRAISAVFAAQALGYLIGAVLSGRGYDRAGGSRLLGGGLLAVAFAAAIVPIAGSLPMLSLAFIVLGLGVGALDVGANTLIVWQHGERAGPYLNALHLAFGLGALSVPVLVNRSLAWGGDARIACWTIAALAATTALATLLGDAPRPRAAVDDSLSPGGHDPRSLALLAGFFVFAISLELGFSGWIATYAKTLGMGGANGAAIFTTVFWASFTLSRLASIVISHRVGPSSMIAAATALAITAAALLVGVGSSTPSAFVATALFGAAIAPLVPTIFVYAERQLSLTGVATSWFIGASAVGSFALPWLVGQLYDAAGARVMPIAMLATAVATAGWFVLIGRRVGRAT